MRRHLTWTAAALLTGLGLGGSALSSPPARLLPTPLLPITEADQTGINETGCVQSFDQGNSSYLYAIKHTLLMRDTAGLKRCTITEAQSQSFGMHSTTLTCGGRQLTVRPVGRAQPNEASDSNGGDATLTMTQGGHTRTVRGTWGVAC